MLGGAVVGYAHQATIILVGLWLTPFLLRHVGQQQLGLWIVSGQVLGYLALMDLGVLAILPREIAKASGVSSRESLDARVSALIDRVTPIVRWQMVALSITAFLILLFLPTEWRTLRWPLALVFLAFVTFYPARIQTAALQGLQDLQFLARCQFAGWVIGTLVTIGIVLLGGGLYSLVLGWISTTAIPSLAVWRRARGRWPRPLGSIEREPINEYFQRSGWVSVGQVAQVLLNGSDLLLLGQLLGPAAVVPYACTGKLVTVFANHPQMLMHAAQPALAELRASESRERLAAVSMALAQAMLVMSGALIVAIIPVNQFFVSWWVGPEQWGGWGLTVAFAAMMLLRHWNVATVYTLFCFGYERRISLTSIADGIVTVIGTTLMVWKWGAIGAPLGSILGVGFVGLPMNVRSVARELDLTVWAFLRRLIPIITRIVILAGLAVVGSKWTSGQSFWRVVTVAVPLMGAYVLAVLPIVWYGPIGPYLRIALSGFVRHDRLTTDAHRSGPTRVGLFDRWLLRLVEGKNG